MSADLNGQSIVLLVVVQNLPHFLTYEMALQLASLPPTIEKSTDCM